MHILYISEGCPPESDARSQRLLAHAREWVKAGHRVSVITKAPNHPNGILFPGYRNSWHSLEAIEGLQVHHVWSLLSSNKHMLKYLLACITFLLSAVVQSFRVKNVDIVLATAPTPFAGLIGYAIAGIKRAPFVYELRDVWPEALQSLYRGRASGAIRIIFRSVGNYLYKRAAIIICVAEGQNSILKHHYGLPPEKMRLVPNAADLSLFKITGNRDAFRDSLGWEGKFVILYAGNLGFSHNLETILEVAERVKSYAAIHFIIIGSGSKKESLEALCRQRNLHNVAFYDQRPRDSMPAFYEAADLSFIPLQRVFSDYARPLKLYESMAMGLPVLLAGSGEAAGMVQEAQAGIVVPTEDVGCAADAIIDLHLNPERLRELKKLGPLYIARHYSREKMALEALRIMEEVYAKT